MKLFGKRNHKEEKSAETEMKQEVPEELREELMNSLKEDPKLVFNIEGAEALDRKDEQTEPLKIEGEALVHNTEAEAQHSEADALFIRQLHDLLRGNDTQTDDSGIRPEDEEAEEEAEPTSVQSTEGTDDRADLEEIPVLDLSFHEEEPAEAAEASFEEPDREPAAGTEAVCTEHAAETGAEREAEAPAEPEAESCAITADEPETVQEPEAFQEEDIAEEILEQALPAAEPEEKAAEQEDFAQTVSDTDSSQPSDEDHSEPEDDGTVVPVQTAVTYESVADAVTRAIVAENSRETSPTRAPIDDDTLLAELYALIGGPDRSAKPAEVDTDADTTVQTSQQVEQEQEAEQLTVSAEEDTPVPQPIQPEQPEEEPEEICEEPEEVEELHGAPGWLKGLFLLILSLLLSGMTLYAVAADVFGKLF